MSTAIRSLYSRVGIGLTANVVQRSSLRISHLAVDGPALILLRNGEKALSVGTRQWQAGRGDAVVLAGGQTIDVENRLSADGLFEARWLVWDARLFAQAESLLPGRRPLSDLAVLKQVPAGFTAAVDRAVASIADASSVPENVAAHQLIELLLWLAEDGIRLSGGRAVSTAAKLRGLLTGTPGSPWTVAMAAEQMATSEATLRRRLGDEGTSFNTVLTDTRMALAMTWLQSTDRPVATIAMDVGYESASRFAIRFKRRYGFSPSVVRGHLR